MKNSLLYYLRSKLSKYRSYRFEVVLKDSGKRESYTMEISNKEHDYTALYIKWFNEPRLFSQKFSSEEVQLRETHLTLDNNKENTHVTYVFENKKVRIYGINNATPSYVTLKNENEESKQTFSFEDFKKIANPEFIKSIADYQTLFHSLSKEQMESRNKLQTKLNELTQSFHTLLDHVEEKHYVAQEERDKFYSIMAEMENCSEEITQTHAGDTYDLSFYKKWNDLLSVGALSNEFYFSEALESSSKIIKNEMKNVTSVSSKNSNLKNKGKKKEKINKSSSDEKSMAWDNFFEEYDKTKKESQKFRDDMEKGDINSIRSSYDCVSQKPGFNAHLEFFFGLLTRHYASSEEQRKILEINTFFLEEKKSEHYVSLFNFFVDFRVYTVDVSSGVVLFSVIGVAILCAQVDILEMFLKQKPQNNIGVYFQTAELNQRQYNTLGLLNVADMLLNVFPVIVKQSEDYVLDVQNCIKILLKYEVKRSYETNQVFFAYMIDNSCMLKGPSALKALAAQLTQYSDVSRESFMTSRCLEFSQITYVACSKDKQIANYSPEEARASIDRFIAEQTILMDTLEINHLLCLYVYFLLGNQIIIEKIENDEKEQGIFVDPPPHVLNVKMNIDVFKNLLEKRILNCFQCLENTEQRKWFRFLVEKGRNGVREFLTIGSFFMSVMKTKEIADYVCVLEFVTAVAERPDSSLFDVYDLPLQLCPSEKRDTFLQELNADASKFDQVKTQESLFLLFVLKTIQTICKNVIKSRESFHLVRFEILPEIMIKQLECYYFTRQGQMDYLKKGLAKALTPVKEMLINENLAENEPDNFLKINTIIQGLNTRWNLCLDNDGMRCSSSFWSALPFACEEESLSNFCINQHANQSNNYHG